MPKPTFLSVLLLAFAVTANAQYVFKPVDLGPKWTSAIYDHQGGLCYSDGSQILHLDQTGGNSLLLFSASELSGWSLTPDYFCEGADVYAVMQRRSAQKQLAPDFLLVRKRNRGAAQVVLQTGQSFMLTLAGQPVNGTPYIPYTQSGGVVSYDPNFAPLYVYDSSAGRIFVEVHIAYSSGPHAGQGGWVEVELNADTTIAALADAINFPVPSHYQIWGGTAQYLWLAIQTSGTDVWQLWKFDKSGKGQMVGDPVKIQAERAMPLLLQRFFLRAVLATIH